MSYSYHFAFMIRDPNVKMLLLSKKHQTLAEIFKLLRENNNDKNF